MDVCDISDEISCLHMAFPEALEWKCLVCDFVISNRVRKGMQDKKVESELWKK